MPHMLVPASRAGRFLVFAISISMSLPAVAAAQGHILYGLTSNNTLVRFNSATPGIVETLEISGIADTEVMRAIDFRSLTGQMYGIATDGVGQSVRTYTIDPATGAATTHGSSVVVSAPTPQWGMSFSPVVDRIRIVNSAGESFRINPTTHELAAKDPNLSSPTPPVVDAIAYDRQFAGATQTTLFVIDRATFSLAYQGGLNGTGPGGQNGGVITLIGPLGVPLSGSPTALDMSTNGVLFAAMRPVGGGSTLYTINPSTGAASLIGVIGDGVLDIVGLAVVDPSMMVSPGTGTYTSRQRFDLVLLLDLAARGVVTGSAMFNGADVTGILASCLVPGAGASALVTFRCAGLGGPVVGSGTHTLEVRLVLTDGSQIRRSVVWTVLPIAEP